MKKIHLIFLLYFIILVLTACNSHEDVKHISQKDMINYVKKAIGEDVSFVSVDGNEDDDVMTYVFNLDVRNVTFKATSVINAMFVDGSQFGNYKEEIYIYYEEGIAESEYYIAERLRIGNDLNINDDDMDYGLAAIYVDNYNDIEKVAQFAVKLDKLYAFNEKKPKLIKHIDVGAISFSDPGNSIAGPRFSTDINKRLNYKGVYKELVRSYIEQLKMFDQIDNKIPENVWNNY